MRYIIVKTPKRYWIYKLWEEYLANMRFAEESKFYVETEMYKTTFNMPEVNTKWI